MATPPRKGEEEKETVTHFHTQKAEGEPVLSKFTGVSDFCLLWHWVFHFLDKWLANSMLPFFLCSSLVLRCDPPHSTSSFLLRRRRRRCPKATRGGPRRPDAKKNFLRFSFFKKTPPPSLFGTVSSAGERIHQSCLYPVSVLSLDFGGSHRVWQIPNSPIRGNQAELKATTEEERMDYFCKARPPNFFLPSPFPLFLESV